MLNGEADRRESCSLLVLELSHHNIGVQQLRFENDHLLIQELSYQKQIARQLRIQYVEGISSNPVTLKSRLRITQGH